MTLEKAEPAAVLGPWPPPGPDTYREVAARLLELSANATSTAAKRQFALLAALYEKLATQSALNANSYHPGAPGD